MKRIVFVAGIPASGKTTYCKNMGKPFSFDDWLKVNYAEDVEGAGWQFIHDKDGIGLYTDAIVEELGDDGVIWLDDGAVDRNRRMEIVRRLRAAGVERIDCVYLLCPMYVAAERNMKREWPISRHSFYASCTRQEYPTVGEGFDSVEFIVTGGDA